MVQDWKIADVVEKNPVAQIDAKVVKEDEKWKIVEEKLGKLEKGKIETDTKIKELKKEVIDLKEEY